MTQECAAGSIDDIPDGTMRQVEVNGEQVLLVRHGADVHAIGARCLHAGAPLVEGVLHGERLVCPWHKATFCVRTGEVLEPPAVDALKRYDTRIEDRQIFVSGAVMPKPSVVHSDLRCIVVVGAGAAGAAAVQTLREVGFAGRVVMLDQENRVPYDRTLLSKYFLSGEKGAEKTPLQSQTFYQDRRIERITADVSHLDAKQRRIECADGMVLHYDAALVATGSSPIQPDFPGSDLGNVFVLRNREDAEAILKQAERSERVVVLGASFIGLEVAASLRERGLEVTVVAREHAPLIERLGEQIGHTFTALHESHGVVFRFGSMVDRLQGEGTVRQVVLKDGSNIAGDLVVIGFGVKPVTNFINGVPLNDDESINVDATMRAVEGLYVAGDVARFPAYGTGEPIRVEHWRVAQQQGRLAARNMAGATLRYSQAPVFWTIQYMKRLDYVGHTDGWDEIIVHGDPAEQDFLAYYVKSGIVTAAAGMGRDKDTAALGELFSVRHDWTPQELGSQPAARLSSQPRTGQPNEMSSNE